MSARNVTMNDLLGAIFEQIDTVRDAEGEEVDQAIAKAEAVSDLSDKAIRTYGLMLNTVKLQDRRTGPRRDWAELPHALGGDGDGE